MPITVDYYITLNSPFTYLGCALLAEIAQRNNATVNVKPSKFGPIFEQTDRRAAAAEALTATPCVSNDGAEALGRGARYSVNA
jgi:2-hydroxychromene-2-carboxylate isomerase